MAKKKSRVRSKLVRGDCASGCGRMAKATRGDKFCCKRCRKLILPQWEGACIEWAKLTTLPMVEGEATAA